MFAVIGGPAGAQPFNDWFAPDTTQRMPLGTKVTAVDPYWGEGEFMYVKSGAAILKGSLVQVGGATIANGAITAYVGVLLVSTAGMGRPFGVAMAPMASGTFGWIQISGVCVYKTDATVAADTVIGIGAAGIAGTNTAGKQLLNVRNTVSATGTITGVVNTTTGNGNLVFRDGYDGFFLGLAITGTGIPASTVVAKLDPDGRTVYAGSAIGVLGDKNSTASGSITLTGTYTGFGQGVIQYPFTQGAIL